jgi:hypothetical protein
MHKFLKTCKSSKIILYIFINIFITWHCKLIFMHIFDNICIKIYSFVTRLSVKTPVTIYKYLCSDLLLLLCNRNYF